MYEDVPYAYAFDYATIIAMCNWLAEYKKIPLRCIEIRNDRVLEGITLVGNGLYFVTVDFYQTIISYTLGSIF